MKPKLWQSVFCDVECIYVAEWLSILLYFGENATISKPSERFYMFWILLQGTLCVRGREVHLITIILPLN